MGPTRASTPPSITKTTSLACLMHRCVWESRANASFSLYAYHSLIGKPPTPSPWPSPWTKLGQALERDRLSEVLRRLRWRRHRLRCLQDCLYLNVIRPAGISITAELPGGSMDSWRRSVRERLVYTPLDKQASRDPCDRMLTHSPSNPVHGRLRRQ